MQPIQCSTSLQAGFRCGQLSGRCLGEAILHVSHCSSFRDIEWWALAVIWAPRDQLQWSSELGLLVEFFRGKGQTGKINLSQLNVFLTDLRMHIYLRVYLGLLASKVQRIYHIGLEVNPVSSQPQTAF